MTSVWRKLFALIMLCVLMTGIVSAAVPAYAEDILLPVPEAPRVFDAAGATLHSAADPSIYSNTTEVGIGETYYLSWNEPDVDYCVLYKEYNSEGFVSLGYVDKTINNYACQESEIGSYTYVIMTLKNGEEWKQSNYLTVTVSADEETTCAFLRNKGMTNAWNLLFMVYRTVSIGNYNKSFSDAQISSIKKIASEMKYTLEGLSDGRMKIGTVDIMIVDEPVTSASQWYNEYGGPPALTYGKSGDVDFTYIMDHKDITLVCVVAPLLGMNGGYGWLGLGGTAIKVGAQDLYTVIVNDIDTSSARTACEGKNYLNSASAFVHEILHCVETNSRSIGWNKFQALHSGDENGYGNGTYRWYHLLMTDTMDNGNKGFLKQSYYVRHYPVSGNMRNGLHKDYDGVYRYYINGLPHIIDLFLPASTKTINAEAFQYISAKSVLIPETVKDIGANAFNPGTVIYGKGGSYAENWANQNGYTFIRINE